MNRVRVSWENRVVGSLRVKPALSGVGVIKRLGIGLAAAVCFLMLNAEASAATYFSQGSVAPNTLTNWNTNRLGGGSSPANFTTGGDVFVIQGTGNGGTSPHNMTTSATWSFGASGSKLQIENGATLTATSAVTISSAGTATTFQIDSGGTYVHNNTGAYASTIFNGTESFAATSTVILNNSGGTGPTGVTFGNLTINFTTDPGVTVSCSGGITTINGSLTVTNTQGQEFRLTGNTALTLNIAGSYSQSGGTFVLGNGTADPIINISGDFSMSGGTLNMSENNATNSTLNVSGDFSHTAGTITETNNGDGTIVFKKTGTQTYTSGGTVSNTINFTVNSGATLQMAAAGTIVSGAGTFTLSSGATLGIKSTVGITAAVGTATGNIQTTTGRSFNTGANYTYNGSAGQATGTGLPTNLTGILTINNPGNAVTLDNARTIASGGTVNLIDGIFAAGTNLTLATTSSITRSGGTMTGTPQGAGVYNVTYTGGSMAATTELNGSGLNNVTVNLTSGQTLTLGAAVTTDGNLTIGSGAILDVSTFALNVGGSWSNSGTFTANAGTVTFTSTSTGKTVAGTLTGTSKFFNVTFNGSGGGWTFSNDAAIGGDFTISNGDVDFNGSGGARSITVTGNFNHQGGNIDLGSGNGLTTVHLGGNLTSTTATGTCTTGGAPSSNDIFSFEKAGVQTISLNTPANYTFINHTVTSGSTLLLGSSITLVRWTSATFIGKLAINSGATIQFPASFSVSGTATGGSNLPTFTLSSGATIVTANTTGVDGSVSTTNLTATFNAGANYTYNGTANQTTLGANYPTNLTGILTINNPGNTVSLTSGRTIAGGGSVGIVAGTFATGGNLTMATTSSISRSGGGMTGTPAGAGVYNVTYSGNAMTTTAELTGSGLNNVTVNLTGGQTLTLGAAVVAAGTVTLTSGTLDASGSNFVISLAGNWANNGGTFTPQGGTVTFNSTAAAQAINGSATSQTFNKLTVNKNGQTLSVAGSTTTLALNSDLNITAGTLSAGTATAINIAGNWSNSGTYTKNAETVTFNGSSGAQTIGGSQTTSFKNISVGNSAGVTLAVNTNVAGDLGLASGDVNTSTFTLFQNPGSTSSGVGDVVGKVNRTDSGAFGNQNVIITKGAGNDVPSYDVVLTKGATSKSTSVLRQYDITANGGAVQTASLRLRYRRSPVDELNGNSESPCTNLQLWKRTGTLWTGQGATSCSSTSDSDRWVELAAVTSFSPWTIAGLGAPTACKLESFNASRSNDGVVLEWHTGLEVDNIGFNVYRETEAGKPVRLTPHLVAGSALMVRRGTTLTAGLGYSWTDPETRAGDSPRYWLEDLDISGQSTWSGPFWIDENRKPSRSLSPLALRSPMINSGDAANSPMINAINSVNSPMINTVNSATVNSINTLNPANAQQLAAATGQAAQYEASGQAELKAATVKLTGTGLIQQINLAGQPAVKISVRQEGYYRVNQPDLLAAGLDPSIDPRKLQLYVDGVQIPMIVRGENDGNFGPQDSIEFYGLGLDTASTDTHVYWLIAGAQPGSRITTFKGASGAGSADSFPYIVQRKDRLYYFSNIPNGDKENFFGAFIYYQPTDQTLSVNHLAPAATASLEVAMQGFNVGKHLVAVSVNGALIGNLDFNDQVYSVSTLTFPQSLLTEGTNTVTMTAQAGNSDFSFVDYMKLTYSHSYNADANALKFTSSPSRSVTVNGFSDPAIRVMDVTDPGSPQEMLGRVSQTPQGYSVTTGTSGGTATRTLMVFLDAQAKAAAKVTANRVSNLRQASNTADLVMVTYADFASSFQSLKSLRASQGLETQLVDIEDVYDEFNGGNKSPQALKDFLSYARTNWKKAPKYVLLGGTASFDPRNYLNVGATDFVPTMFVQTQRIETASDDAFADFNNDGIPEMAVGRLPARTADEAARMVQKVISYDQAQASGSGVLLVADVNNGFDFEANNDQLMSLVPKGTPVQDIRRGSDPQAKQNLLDALNLGKKLVNYTGHGSVDIWEANLLTDADAATLVNAQKLSVVVAMTCLNGYFIDERIESLAHALLNSPNGGAVAMWSSSGLTMADAQAAADFELFRQLFAGTSIRLGDATIRAKTAVSDIDVRRTWILIGDPTMRFRQ